MKVICKNCGAERAYSVKDRGGSVPCARCDGQIELPSERIFEGQILSDDFVVTSYVAGGGMGSVFVAKQRSLDIDVALKILHEELSSDRDYIAEFIAEAQNTAKLNHPNIVGVSAVGHDEDVYYIVLELIRGASVAQMLERGPLDIHESVRIIRKTAQALAHAWDLEGIVHRDIKPANIMVRQRDAEVKLADLGLARPARDLRTWDGEVNVTPQYLCPDLVNGVPVDQRSDIYCLGASWYHMITGRFAFEGASLMQIMRAHMSRELVPPRTINTEIPAMINDIIVKMMAKKPEDRFQSYRELLKAIRAVERGTRRFKVRTALNVTVVDAGQNAERSDTKRRTILLAAVAALAVILALITAASNRHPAIEFAAPPRALQTTPRQPVFQGPADFTGTWKSGDCELTLHQVGTVVEGSYNYGEGSKGQLRGVVEDNVLTGRWTEDKEAGDVEFTMLEDGRHFWGRYNHDEDGTWVNDWSGILAEPGPTPEKVPFPAGKLSAKNQVTAK